MLLQMFLWWRLSLIVPKSIEFPAVVMEEVIMVDGFTGTCLSNTYKPREWRWLNDKQSASKPLFKVIDKEEGSFFRRYSYSPQSILKSTCLEKRKRNLG